MAENMFLSDGSSDVLSCVTQIQAQSESHSLVSTARKEPIEAESQSAHSSEVLFTISEEEKMEEERNNEALVLKLLGLEGDPGTFIEQLEKTNGNDWSPGRMELLRYAKETLKKIRKELKIKEGLRANDQELKPEEGLRVKNRRPKSKRSLSF